LLVTPAQLLVLVQHFLATPDFSRPAQREMYLLHSNSPTSYEEQQRAFARTFPQLTAPPPPPPAWAQHLSISGACFAGSAIVLMEDGSERRICSVREGESVLGWPSAEAAAPTRGSPRPMRVQTVQATQLSSVAPALYGVRLQPAAGELTLPPFFTANHPLLAADGTWHAVDCGSATAEALADVKPLLVGSRLATLSAAPGATVTAIAHVGVPPGTVVYNLELDSPYNAVYIVNGLLCMD